MTVENQNDLEGLIKIGRIVADCLQFMAKKLEPRITKEKSKMKMVERELIALVESKIDKLDLHNLSSYMDQPLIAI